MADRYFSTEEEAIQDLVRRGLVVDSGQKRWCQRTRSYQVVWKCTKLGEEYDNRNMLNRKWSFWMTILRGAALARLGVQRYFYPSGVKRKAAVPPRMPGLSGIKT